MKLPLEIQRIIEYGIKAPSGHNTQPWKFLATKTEIQIHPDFDRALPIVDADNHALYISLGCATENIILAAKNAGFNAEPEIQKNKKGEDFIAIKLQRDKSVKSDELFNFINKRQVTRNAYKKTPIAPEDLKRLIDSTRFKGVQVRSFLSKGEIEILEPFIIEGSNLQFENDAFVNELVSWIRFSKKEVEKKRDGIWHASMGLPPTGRFLGNLIMKRFVSAKSEAKRWTKIIQSSAGFLLFIAEKNDVNHWVKVGRVFQRFGLMSTKLNISHAHVNMPCEELAVRKKMATKLGLEDQYPLLLVRFGYSEKMPYSYRRPIEQVVQYEERFGYSKP